MQSEKLEYDHKMNYGKLMPRRAENFGMPTDYRRNPRTSVWFPSVVACYLFWKMPIFLIPLGFGFFFAKRNKVQTHPPPSPLRILIVPVTAAKRNKRSMDAVVGRAISIFLLSVSLKYSLSIVSSKCSKEHPLNCGRDNKCKETNWSSGAPRIINGWWL